MKKIYIGLIITFMIISGGCSDLLETVPKDKISSATFWKSKNDVKLALAGCYKHLRTSTFLSQLKPYMDTFTDNGYCWQTTYSEFSQVKKGILTAQTAGPVKNIYESMYKGITACNIFLENFDRVKEQLGYGNEADIITAEVRFLRAYFLFELVQRYGGVVVYDDVPSVENSKIKQRTKEECLKYIDDDISYAIQHLPDDIYKGHVVKNSARGLNARIALFQKDWNKVELLTKEIIGSEASGKTEFAASYDPIFIKRLGQNNCKEILFAVEYLAPDAKQNYGVEIEGFYWSGLTPYKSFVKEYLPEDKRRLEWYYEAKDGAYLRPTDNTWFMPRNTTRTGYGCVKYFDKMNPDKYVMNPYDISTDDNVVLIRYSEILLMYAEAKVENGGGNTTDELAIASINRIRARAGIPPIEGVLDRDVVRQERRLELAFEGFRLFDLHRWKIAEEVMNGFQTIGDVCKFEPYHYIWPFPQSEIDVNPQLEQNPGY